MTTAFETHTDLTVAGGPIRLFQRGDGPQSLLLLHGGMLDTAAGVWRHTVDHFAAEYRVHAIDMPRHGGSRPWHGKLDQSFFDKLIEELLDQLGIDQVTIIGLSLGGGAGIGYALRHPHRVRALVAIGPGGLGAKRPAQFSTWCFLRTPMALRLTSTFLAKNPGLVRKSMVANLTAGTGTRDFDTILALAQAEAHAKTRHRERALDDWMVEAYGPWSMRLNYIPQLPQLRVPTLWMRGENDPLVQHPELSAAAHATPRGHLRTIADAGHIVTYDQPEQFHHEVDSFLTEVASNEPQQ